MKLRTFPTDDRGSATVAETQQTARNLKHMQRERDKRQISVCDMSCKAMKKIEDNKLTEW